MFDILNLNPETQSNFSWIFLDAVLHTDYKTEAEFHTFLRKLNTDWLIKSKNNIDFSSEDCLILAIGDILKNHINSKEMAEHCHQELTSKWIFHQKYTQQAAIE
ncbi:hypothetical protein [Runella zeae]|uniref:hypothetical protein n=1 Tax=Runella zeae TaxID=94255 RepID=UPI0004179CB1|nr:hypothetical protein [Runella zeae]